MQYRSAQTGCSLHEPQLLHTSAQHCLDWGAFSRTTARACVTVQCQGYAELFFFLSHFAVVVGAVPQGSNNAARLLQLYWAHHQIVLPKHAAQCEWEYNQRELWRWESLVPRGSPMCAISFGTIVLVRAVLAQLSQYHPINSVSDSD